MLHTCTHNTAECPISDRSHKLNHINIFTTRKLCYREDDCAMHPIYECLSCLFTETD